MTFSSRTIRTTAAGALAAVILAVAACGSDDSSSGSSGKLKGTTIDYWASNQGSTIDQDNQVINEAAARFKKETRRHRQAQGHPVVGPVHQHHDRDDERQGP